MLLRFRFSNFRSFRSEQEFSLVAGPLKDHIDRLVRVPATPEPILTTAALYGANASGKTNFIRALQFMANAVEFSHTRWQPHQAIPRQPFLSVPDRERPSEFIIDFIPDGVRYQYGFSVSDTTVLKEWLYAYPKGKRQVWFSRCSGAPIAFSEKMGGENKTIEALTRQNSLFLSTAAQNNHPALSPIHRWFSGSLTFVLAERSSGTFNGASFCADPVHRETISRMVAHADLGISSLRLTGGEGMPDVETCPKQVQLLHRLSDEVLPFETDQESHGTIVYLTLLGPIVSTLESGGVLCVDEMDASLHPLLALRLVELFGEPSLNLKHAQLIFNTHDTNLLSRGNLRRDQIWFAEKKRDGSSQIYPLTDFQPRKDENIANGYLQGRYGAVPFLNPDLLTPNRGIEHGEA
jgi:hypothetical protein